MSRKVLQLKFTHGLTAYDLLLEEGSPLLSKRTLCRRLHHLSFQAGIRTEMLEVMEVEVCATSNIEEDCFVFRQDGNKKWTGALLWH